MGERVGSFPIVAATKANAGRSSWCRSLRLSGCDHSVLDRMTAGVGIWTEGAEVHVQLGSSPTPRSVLMRPDGLKPPMLEFLFSKR